MGLGYFAEHCSSQIPFDELRAKVSGLSDDADPQLNFSRSRVPILRRGVWLKGTLPCAYASCMHDSDTYFPFSGVCCGVCPNTLATIGTRVGSAGGHCVMLGIIR